MKAPLTRAAWIIALLSGEGAVEATSAARNNPSKTSTITTAEIVSLEPQSKVAKQLLSKAISVNSEEGKRLLEAAANDDENVNDDGNDGYGYDDANNQYKQKTTVDTTFLQGYSMKFQGCWHINRWNRNPYSRKDPKVITKRYVRFRLCPQDSCKDSHENGCTSEYGDYIIDLNLFVDAYLADAKVDKYSEKFMKRSEIRACRTIVNGCGCRQQWNDDWYDWEDCFNDCIEDQNADYCEDYREYLEPEQMQEERGLAERKLAYDDYYLANDQIYDGIYDDNEPYYESYWDDGEYMAKYDDYQAGENQADDEDYDAELAFLFRYSSCRKYTGGNYDPYADDTYADDVYNVNDDGVDDDAVQDDSNNKYEQSSNYYLGPYCAESGSSIFLGMFTDRACTVYTDRSGGRNMFHRMTGNPLPFARKSLVDYECVECADPDEVEWIEYGYGDDGQEVQIKNVCTAMYTASGKCEKEMKSSVDLKTNGQSNNSCEFISGIKMVGKPFFRLDNETADGFIYLFLVSTCCLGGYVGFLKWKLNQQKKNNPQAVYFYD
eukprot:CAMPEP_0116016472 /NCGR_PEP_ID=MMETSP0321-20121206/7504_1 /TAXON_ID=163516 /ORGANISM="Leptocylindrus danicus var. danicus, Strain B650" /LENGTH=548 /DNA_ID=CAMNT_0003486543 /DNA_START=30 /DNA_END=1677 /DNA_ORIENTATION=+